MISPGMFGEFMVPVLEEMCERLSHSLYHWDGPGALGHLDHLLSIEKLDMIQWTAGEGNEPPSDKRWWPCYHRIIDAGKKVFIGVAASADTLRSLRREFGSGFNQFLINMGVSSSDEAEEMLRVAAEQAPDVRSRAAGIEAECAVKSVAQPPWVVTTDKGDSPGCTKYLSSAK
jgi:hypothetical protein